MRQIHAHRVAAQAEEKGLAQAEDAGVAPDQVQSHRHDGEGEVAPEHVDRLDGNKAEEVEAGHANDPDEQQDKKRHIRTFGLSGVIGHQPAFLSVRTIPPA